MHRVIVFMAKTNISKSRVQSDDIDKVDQATSHACTNVDAFDSSQWSAFTQLALDWLSRQVIRGSYYTDSGISLNDCPLIESMYRATVDDTTNADIVRWMLSHRNEDDPVRAMAGSVCHTDDHPLPLLRADALELEAIARYSNHGTGTEMSFGMVHYRLTKMLLRLAFTVRNIGQVRRKSPDYDLFVRLL